ncbi:MAG: glutamate synthase large subunit [Thermoplasmata archaeon]|nr:glutamate synthase large subunit [Thermoplasmata archaeon]
MSETEHGGLYDPADERDSCGVGLTVNMDGSKSHRTVEIGLRLLENMAHRGAENGDGRTGDGAGILVQIPHRFIESLRIPVPEAGRYGTGLLFLPKEAASAGRFLELFKAVCQRFAVHVIAVREVPVDHSVPGPMALAGEPRIVQVFVSSFDSPETLERKLFRIRKIVGNSIAASDYEGRDEFYICSLSTRTMVYKGMLTPEQLRAYYLDLSDPLFESAIAMVHSRFSTNTMPAWKLAQPFRMLCHNGEINTIRANRSWMQARESVMSTEAIPDIDEILPVMQSGMSDSATLDNVFEFLTMAGKSMPNALSIMIPESWNDKNPIPDSLKAYYEYHSILMEPWDGPAAVMFTDGTVAGGMLDRNGLRPARYAVTADGTMVLASEAGVIPMEPDEIVETGRLRPGKMIMIDTRTGAFMPDAEIKEALASAYPYRDWLEKNRLDLDKLSSGRQVGRSVPDYGRMLAEFGYTSEDVSRVMEPMVSGGKEPIGSTGFDAPLAVLSDRPQLLFGYFRQMFAQVTNPPIDPIREELVMATTGYIGSVHQNILDPTPKHCKVVKARHPVITNRELDLLRNLRYRGFEAVTLDTTFPATGEPGVLGAEIDRLCREAEGAVDSGASYLILSDRGVSAERAPMPSLLALSAVHQHLVGCKKRLQTALVVESGEPREVMHFALLIGYGANAINPYMALAIVEDMAATGRVKMDADAAEASYLKATDKGLLKIMSKMGIATIRSYRGSRLFEAVGIDRAVAERYFGDTASSVCGIGLDDIASEYLAIHRAALEGADAMAQDAGVYAARKGGERHSWNPETVKALRAAARSGSADDYARFAELVDGRMFYLRDLLGTKAGTPVPLDEVEPAEAIMRRFEAGAISFGAISREAHETLAEAMNSIGSQSNTGEGGEDPARFKVGPDGRNLRSAVKQVASGRFGVTAEYLVNADELQIKVAQGAKPGEGGQLMGFKVDRVIAATRHTIPGITLISPPPHHDIYSIEDLKQLIYDLKCINPTARVSVKLVSESGVGTVAAGVAKAGADMILVSGADGGTGASPLSSLRYAGAPWETGLAEVQQALVANNLRGRVSVQVDGQFKTGRDVIVAALLGAEEFGFATAPMVAMGCIMCRKCQTNTCPVGIATQDPEKRAKFAGTKEDIVNYWRLMAEDVRARLSAMGFRSLDEVVGRTDLLEQLPAEGKAARLDLKPLLFAEQGERKRTTGQPDIVGAVLDRRIIADAEEAMATGRRVDLLYPICNVDRSVGVMLAGETARRELSMKDDTVSVTFNGAAGQSFGAFLTKGITFTLRGLANDYVGKGLSGGRIVVTPGSRIPEGNVIAGNTILYGATSGELFVNGSVGERFCVRNSGAVAVAEGAGDHCCEYMTGGRVVVLGRCGRNFAAGMSAGIAYVYDGDGDFDRHCNMDMVELTLVESPEDAAELRSIIQRHLDYTDSPRAAEILRNWDDELPKFIKVMPVGYKLLLEKESE